MHFVGFLILFILICLTVPSNCFTTTSGRSTLNGAAGTGALLAATGESKVQIGNTDDSIENIGSDVLKPKHKDQATRSRQKRHEQDKNKQPKKIRVTI